MKKRLWVFLTVAGVLAVFCLGFFLGYLTQELTYDQIANYHAKIPAVYVDLGAGTPARAGAGGPERPSGTNIYPPPPLCPPGGGRRGPPGGQRLLLAVYRLLGRKTSVAARRERWSVAGLPPLQPGQAERNTKLYTK